MEEAHWRTQYGELEVETVAQNEETDLTKRRGEREGEAQWRTKKREVKGERVVQIEQMEGRCRRERGMGWRRPTDRRSRRNGG